MLIESRVERVVASGPDLTVTLKTAQGSDATMETIKIPLRVRARSRRREIIPAHGKIQRPRRTLKAERRLTLLTTIAKACEWAEELIKGEVTDINELARREGTSERNLRRALSQAFLSPDIIELTLAGELPPDLVMTRISNSLPLSWSKLRQVLALTQMDCTASVRLSARIVRIRYCAVALDAVIWWARVNN